jgi:sugar transferase (PEP-CTERM/EpsH1 system associated)
MLSGQRIKVVHIVRTLDMGGLEMVVLDLVLRRSARFDVAVLCLEQRGEMADRFEQAGAPVTALKLTETSISRRIWLLSAALRRLRPHVVHTHNVGPHVNGAVAAKFARRPVLVHTKHGRNYGELAKRKLLFQNRVASLLSDKIVCVSHDAANVARQMEKVAEKRIAVIHNGIDVSRFEMSPAPCRSTETIRAIHVARLNPIKDQATLLRAVRIVVDRLPGFHLDVVGEGPAATKVKQLCGELSLSNHVRFHGMRDDVPKLLRSADLFVLSSLSEGISLTLLEAMASGLPVVATDVGGNREVVQTGTTGCLVPSRDPQALADAIIRLCSNGKEAREMGMRGRQRVEQFFSVDIMVNAYEELYCNLLGSSVSFPVPPTAPVRL